MALRRFSYGFSDPTIKALFRRWAGNEYALKGATNAPRYQPAAQASQEAMISYRQVNVAAGETVLVIVHPKTFELVEIDPDQAWFWAREWQQLEREADADLAEGDFEEFDDLDTFLSSL